MKESKKGKGYIPRLTSSRSGELVTSSRLTIYMIIDPFSFLIGAINTEHRNAVPINTKRKKAQYTKAYLGNKKHFRCFHACSYSLKSGSLG